MKDQPQPPEQPLSLAACVDLVVDATNHRDRYVAAGADPDKILLRQLGIFSDTESEDLKGNIQFLLRGHYRIKQADITADPTTTITASAASVKAHAL